MDIKTIVLGKICELNNIFCNFRKKEKIILSELKELNEIKKRSFKRTEMSDHLVNLFRESLLKNPKLIVELGVNTGESTFVFERVAKLTNAKLVSVDITDCSNVTSWKDWLFVKKDDIEFSKEFTSWCSKNKITPKINILFIDTSHLFNHTVKEIESWFPHLSEDAKVIFHDTNLKKVFKRRDGSMGLGFENHRGVIRGIEKYFKCKFNEEKSFTLFKDNWLIKHEPNCNGLMILDKFPKESK